MARYELTFRVTLGPELIPVVGCTPEFKIPNFFRVRAEADDSNVGDRICFMSNAGWILEDMHQAECCDPDGKVSYAGLVTEDLYGAVGPERAE